MTLECMERYIEISDNILINIKLTFLNKSLMELFLAFLTLILRILILFFSNFVKQNSLKFNGETKFRLYLNFTFSKRYPQQSN